MDASYINGLVATAGGGQTVGAKILNTFTRITVVATAADSVLLPPAGAGLSYTVANATANSANVFPAVGDAINALSANAAFALAAGKSAQFNCMVNGVWNVILSA